MFNRIAGEDRYRAVETEIKQGLRQRIDAALCLTVRNPAPLPFGTSALREPGALRRFTGPFRKRGWDMRPVILQRNPRLHDDGAVVAPFDRDVARQPVDLAESRLVQHAG